MTYYNTTNVQGDLLAEYKSKAKTQNEKIEELFRTRRRFLMTPSFVQKTILPNAPVTSIRRAMTNLTELGHLEKTDKTFKGPYGRPEHAWRWIG